MSPQVLELSDILITIGVDELSPFGHIILEIAHENPACLRSVLPINLLQSLADPPLKNISITVLNFGLAFDGLVVPDADYLHGIGFEGAGASSFAFYPLAGEF